MLTFTVPAEARNSKCSNPDGLGRVTFIEHQTTIFKTELYSRILALTPFPLPKILGVPRIFGRGEHICSISDSVQGRSSHSGFSLVVVIHVVVASGNWFFGFQEFRP